MRISDWSSDVCSSDLQDTAKSPGYVVLAREIQKKSRHMPVRQLCGELGDVLTTLTPCLLMSPLSVAQFLAAGSKHFDLVVFDEASQITVRSEEHTSELQSLMRISYAVFCLKKKKKQNK